MQNTDTPDPLLSMADRRRSEMHLEPLERLVAEWEREREAGGDRLLGPMIAEARRRIAKLQRRASEEAGAAKVAKLPKGRRNRAAQDLSGALITAPAA